MGPVCEICRKEIKGKYAKLDYGFFYKRVCTKCLISAVQSLIQRYLRDFWAGVKGAIRLPWTKERKSWQKEHGG